jgi:hypothetical protein
MELILKFSNANLPEGQCAGKDNEVNLYWL